jgi:nanoRNase/pAp phosphatase (c-di-AMP/oligoRNAs hydrolase)
MTMSSPRTKPSERFLKALAPYDQVFVVTHDNPDPDAVATGWALVLLVQQKLQKKAHLVGSWSRRWSWSAGWSFRPTRP